MSDVGHNNSFNTSVPATPAPFCFQQAVVPWSSQVRYLGVILDPKLLFTKHLNFVVRKASVILLQLFPLLARDSTLSLANKLLLYKLFIRSMLTYSAPVWSNASHSKLYRLQVSRSKCLRVIGNYPRRTPIPFLHAVISIPLIYEFIYRSTFHFYTRWSHPPQPLCPLHWGLHLTGFASPL
jgi:hypothetical protein